MSGRPSRRARLDVKVVRSVAAAVVKWWKGSKVEYCPALVNVSGRYLKCTLLAGHPGEHRPLDATCPYATIHLGVTCQCSHPAGHSGLHYYALGGLTFDDSGGRRLTPSMLKESRQMGSEHCEVRQWNIDHFKACDLPVGHTGSHHDHIVGDWNVGAQIVHPVTPGGANRAEKSDLPPAHWYSLDYETVRGLAETQHTGDTTYGPENWMKGLPVSNLLNHAMEHLFKLLSGDSSEPHLEHALWNLGKVRWMAKNKPELVDVPAIRRYFKLEPLGVPVNQAIPADPNPTRNTSCFFCGGYVDPLKVRVIGGDMYKQVHLECFDNPYNSEMKPSFLKVNFAPESASKG